MNIDYEKEPSFNPLFLYLTPNQKQAVLFNSFDFGLFLLIVFTLYWTIGAKNRTAQNILLLLASYFFYGLWDYRFLSLLIASSLVDYFCGIYIKKAVKKSSKIRYLYFSIIWNLGVLFLFKYYGFFTDNFISAFTNNPDPSDYLFLNIIIPVGLSFYTFQTMSYSIDVYRGRIQPSKNLLNFLCFVSFFPQLVAGPIERARNLLPQLEKERKLDIANAKEGLRQILWGLFKKMVIADNIAVAVNTIFLDYEHASSTSLVYASVLFAVQLYCDFSGYSDVAIGSAKLFGIKLSKNFNIPFLAKTNTDFWQRWHISLTKWFTDYVYAPISKSFNKSYLGMLIALFCSMTAIGFWHGANWTFIAFGVLQFLFITIERIPIKIGGTKKTITYYFANLPRFISVFYLIFSLAVSCIFFRSPDMDTALHIFYRIITLQSLTDFSLIIGYKILIIPLLIIADVIKQKNDFPLYKLETIVPRPVRWIIYYSLIFMIIRYAGPKEQFIYFQF